jgi:hypothetical protein
MTLMLEALPAHKGDALLLHFGTEAKPLLAVIDGGPSNTYRPVLRPRLEAIRRQRRLRADAALPIEWLMVSHIDDDHIKGVLELTAELTEAIDDGSAPYRIGSVWHNSFDDLLGTTPDVLKASIAAQFGAASSAESAVELYPALSLDAAKILASVPQGRRLRDDIAKLQIPCNRPFNELVMLMPRAEPRVHFGPARNGGIDVRVIGPLKAQLQALQKAHDTYLRSIKKSKADAEAALAAFTDSSVPNLSSIVVEVSGDGHKLLLTGDARGDYIIEGLKACKLLTARKPYVVDVLKVPHHGSDRNMTQEFFEQVHATHYVFSGDGEHGNPERETLAMLFEARASVASLKTQKFFLHFTYSIEEIDRGRKADWEKELGKGRKTRKWNDKKDSLRVFFENVSGGELEFEILGGDEPVSISLG